MSDPLGPPEEGEYPTVGDEAGEVLCMTRPHYEDDSVTVLFGDCRLRLRELDDGSVDAVVTDPPYELGFMGKSWDASGVAYDVTLWREVFRVLKPGGHLLAFGASRTWHRLAAAVEDAGFELRDSIAWLYGSGFPKSLDVSKAIDKRPGVGRHAEFAQHLAERREAKGLTRQQVATVVVGTPTGACWNWEHHQFPDAKWWPALRDLLDLDEDTWGPVIAEAERVKTGERTVGKLAVAPGQGSDRSAVDVDVTEAATADAKTWEGWGTALKPAFEPIVVARKPLAGTVAANVLTHGTGALNIDATRTEAGQDYLDKCASVVGLASNRNGDAFGEWTGEREDSASPLGRWPTNVVLDDDTAGRVGTAARFFPVFRYEAKAPTDERPRDGEVAHPTVKPLDLMRWLVRLVTPPGGLVLEPFAGSGTTAEACVVEGFRCIAIEKHEPYLQLIVNRLSKDIQPTLGIA